jgi:hypothetical protein
MRFLAHGGVYIAGGGIAAKMIGRIKDGRVLKAYLDQGSRRTKTPPILLDPAEFALIDQKQIPDRTCRKCASSFLSRRCLDGGRGELPVVCLRHD